MHNIDPDNHRIYVINMNWLTVGAPVQYPDRMTRNMTVGCGEGSVSVIDPSLIETNGNLEVQSFLVLHILHRMQLMIQETVTSMLQAMGCYLFPQLKTNQQVGSMVRMI
jgi:hypothetical protein